jgi:hypothetical protein
VVAWTGKIPVALRLEEEPDLATEAVAKTAAVELVCSVVVKETGAMLVTWGEGEKPDTVVVAVTLEEPGLLPVDTRGALGVLGAED